MADKLKTTLDYARYYLDKGISVIPIMENEKRPATGMNWKRFQNEKASEEAIRAWWERNPKWNIAMVCGAVSGKIVIDIDDYKPDSIASKFVALLEAEGCRPLVETPRGGKHYYFDFDTRVVNKSFADVDIKSEGGYVLVAPSKVDGKGYKWIGEERSFGHVFTDSIIEFINANAINGGSHSDSVTSVTKCDKVIPNGSRDHALFHYANVLAKCGVPLEEIRQIIGYIGFHACEQGDDPITQEMIDVKIGSAMKRSGRDKGSLAQEIEEWVSVTTGDFDVTACDRELEIVTKRDKANRRQILKRLVEKGVIERNVNRAGWFRVPDNDEEIIDFSHTAVDPVDIRLPFKITEKLVYLMPKSIVLIAGSPNVGKTAFMLNVVKLNAGGKLPIKFFSSEMGKEDLLDRINLFRDFPKLSKMTFVERSHNFQDVLNPDGLNVIDFLEISTNFYEVGGLMTKIRDKLKTGMAVIAIQKNKNKEEAVGGHFAMEKPRLVVTLDREDMGVAGFQNVARITKAKGRVNMKVNPVGKELIYRLHRGCDFEVLSDWRLDEEYEEENKEVDSKNTF